MLRAIGASGGTQYKCEDKTNATVSTWICFSKSSKEMQHRHVISRLNYQTPRAYRKPPGFIICSSQSPHFYYLIITPVKIVSPSMPDTHSLRTTMIWNNNNYNSSILRHQKKIIGEKLTLRLCVARRGGEVQVSHAPRWCWNLLAAPQRRGLQDVLRVHERRAEGVRLSDRHRVQDRLTGGHRRLLQPAGSAWMVRLVNTYFSVKRRLCR